MERGRKERVIKGKMEISGVIYKIGEVEKIKDFKKRDFVVEMHDRGHVNFIIFELFSTQVDLVEGLKKGDKVEVEFIISGRKWVDKEGIEKYFNSLRAYRIEKN